MNKLCFFSPLLSSSLSNDPIRSPNNLDDGEGFTSSRIEGEGSGGSLLAEVTRWVREAAGGRTLLGEGATSEVVGGAVGMREAVEGVKEGAEEEAGKEAPGTRTTGLNGALLLITSAEGSPERGFFDCSF